MGADKQKVKNARAEAFGLEAETIHREVYGVNNSSNESKHVEAPWFYTESDYEEDITLHLAAYSSAVGPIAKGNKRLGKQPLYWDLTALFIKFKRQGIRLPKHCVSKAHLTNGLLDVIRRHTGTKYNCYTEQKILNSPEIKAQMHHDYAGIFQQVISEIEKTPVIINAA